MSSNTIHVSNISPSTSQAELEAFFSYCGKIRSISVTPATAAANASQSATVTFERSSAAQTALLLDQTRLGDSNVHVEAAHTLDEIAGGKVASGAADEGLEGDKLLQEDKPKTAVLAEYLSAGYAVGDTALQKGIEIDQKAGITTRFTSLLHTLDAKLHATERAKTVDSTYHVTDKLVQGQNLLSQYFEKALDNPTGKKIRDFYAQGAKQVVDIHTEALRLAEEKKKNLAQQTEKGTGIVGPEKTTCACGGDAGACKCAPEKCACAGCHNHNKSSVPEVGTAQGGAASRQFGEVKEDVKAVAKDLA
ncbi:hypothetical protein DFH27DRAFT_565815 [Peziza echinospora]|nr:hypothetical protein DFH27DRAFT_565815 [Peziza echinospora]